MIAFTPEYKEPRCPNCRQADITNTRLLENNRTLQAKLREGNRAILREVIKILNEEYVLNGERVWTKADIRDRVEALLSFQQEPQEL